MGTKSSKASDRESSIKIRIDSKLKDEFKKITQEKNTDMSKEIINFINNYINQNSTSVKSDIKKLEQHQIETDKKLLKLKQKLINNNNSITSNDFSFFNLFKKKER